MRFWSSNGWTDDFDNAESIEPLTYQFTRPNKIVNKSVVFFIAEVEYECEI